MMKKDAVVLVFSRNTFYKRLHYLALVAFLLAVLVIIVLGSVLYFLSKNPPRPLYFATDSVGRLIPIIPVDKPNMSTDDVIAWATNAVQKAYSYDYVNYRSQLQNAQKYFTNYGWSNYMTALTASNNLPALNTRRQIVIMQVVPPVKVITQGILGGAYAWKFQMQALVTYWEPPYDEKDKNLNPLTVSVIVQRQEILKSDEGLGIVQLVASMASTPSTQPQQISATPTG